MSVWFLKAFIGGVSQFVRNWSGALVMLRYQAQFALHLFVVVSEVVPR